jgi:hypothetical protein
VVVYEQYGVCVSDLEFGRCFDFLSSVGVSKITPTLFIQFNEWIPEQSFAVSQLGQFVTLLLRHAGADADQGC